MIKRYCRFLCILFFALFSYTKAKATHIVGGEIYYDYLGSNNYQITMKVYRDCINGQIGLDNPAFMTIYDVNNAIVQTMSVPLASSSFVPPSINNPCIQTPNNVCVEEGIYTTTVNLPPKTGGYYVVYQRCCRNNTILNLVNPGQVGSTYWEHIPGPEVVSQNSSPRFTKFPPIFICNGIPIAFDHAATDPDGDQLVYSLCQPFDGLSACCPMVSNPPSSVGVCAFPPLACPTVNDPPPYVSVPFVAPYSAGYPMATSPAININTFTGFLDGVPNLNGQWVVGVCVQEFRNGVLVGTHHRDFQFNVVACQVTVLSAMMSQTQFCAGLAVQFQNQSIGNNLTYHWDFGVNSILSDTSNTLNPGFVYPDTGKYLVTLIANPGKPCADTSTRTFYVYPDLQVSFVSPPGQCLDNNSFNFMAAGAFTGNGTFTWEFGANANPVVSNAQNPIGVNFNAPGTYPVWLKVSENGCKDSVQGSVLVYDQPTAHFDNTSLTGCDPFTVTLNNSSTADTPMSYFWQFSDGTTSTDPNPTHTFTPPGNYDITLIITTSNGCVAADTFSAPGMIRVQSSPLSQFNATPTVTSVFEPTVYFYNTSSSDAVSWTYDFGDGNTATVPYPSHDFYAWGDYNVTLTVTNALGCPNTSSLVIRILPEFRFWVPNAFTPGNKDNLNDIFRPVVMGVVEYNFYVFDRWGVLIYQTDSPDEGWDGTYKGNKSPMDVYVWKCTFKNLVTSRSEEHVGHLSLVR